MILGLSKIMKTENKNSNNEQDTLVYLWKSCLHIMVKCYMQNLICIFQPNKSQLSFLPTFIVNVL